MLHKNVFLKFTRCECNAVLVLTPVCRPFLSQKDRKQNWETFFFFQMHLQANSQSEMMCMLICKWTAEYLLNTCASRIRDALFKETVLL